MSKNGENKDESKIKMCWLLVAERILLILAIIGLISFSGVSLVKSFYAPNNSAQQMVSSENVVTESIETKTEVDKQTDVATNRTVEKMRFREVNPRLFLYAFCFVALAVLVLFIYGFYFKNDSMIRCMKLDELHSIRKDMLKPHKNTCTLKAIVESLRKTAAILEETSESLDKEKSVFDENNISQNEKNLEKKVELLKHYMDSIVDI